MDTTQITPPRKRSSFKRTIMYVLVLGVLGGASYLAYEQGAMDQYLPKPLKAIAEKLPEPVSAPTPPTQSVAPSALNQLQDKQTATNNDVTAPPSNIAPVAISINGAPANALLSAYDAQWQWQMIEQAFKAQGDVTNTLQQVQALKTQLQSTNSAAFASALAALSQVETQLQAWTPLQTSGYLSALEQTIVDVDAMNMKVAANDDISAATAGEQTWWQRTLASLKNVIEIKRVDEQKNSAALSASTGALVKQSIVARLSSAQLAAQMGQWPAAQSHAKAAQALAEQWTDVASLTKIKPLLDVASFPILPEFNTVQSALMQARAQLINEARAAQNLPPPAAPNTPAPAAAPKGGA